MLGLVEFGVVVEEGCPSVGLGAVTGVGVGDRGGGGLVEGDSVGLFVVDLEVEIARRDGDGSC